MFTSGLATVLTPFSISAFHSASPFGKNCEFEELKNVHHGFLVEVITEQQGSHFFFRSQGDRSVEAVAVTSRVTMKRATDFFQKFVSIHFSHKPLTLLFQLHSPGEPAPPTPAELEKHDTDFDLKSHNSDSCRTCLAIRYNFGPNFHPSLVDLI